ncbi:hypothetical protein C0995_009808 [Termitomyces sp. Mi166|nr:hypothetical protein C0995_009808 [Termitomyces sp. Mi166\
MSNSSPSRDIEEFRKVLNASQHIIVLAGAGLSAASGIPTFRNGGGLWRSLDATELATPQAFAANPSLVWQFYHYRRIKALAAQPNDAHKLLAKMSIPSYLKTIAPAAKSYYLVTQNVDRLSINSVEALSKDVGDKKSPADHPRRGSVYQMHGRLFEVKCTSCEWHEEDLSNPLCTALGEADSNLQDYHDAGSKANDIPESELPRCRQCGALARPGVVWFGEKPFYLDEINSLVYKADLCLIIGTSLTRHKGKVAIFNLDPTEKDNEADFLFSGRCEVELLRVLGVEPDSI